MATHRQARTVSGKIIGEVFRYAPEDLTETQFRVLLVLAESARDKTRISRTNTAEIADMARRSQGTVRNAIMELTRRCLVYPVGGKARRGHAQDYRIVELHAHHRAATSRPKASLLEMTQTEEEASLLEMTQEVVDNPPADQRKRHFGGEKASSLEMTPSVKISSVTTVSKNLSRQVTRTRDPRQAAALRFAPLANETPTKPNPWTRAGP